MVPGELPNTGQEGLVETREVVGAAVLGADYALSNFQRYESALKCKFMNNGTAFQLASPVRTVFGA